MAGSDRHKPEKTCTTAKIAKERAEKQKQNMFKRFKKQ